MIFDTPLIGYIFPSGLVAARAGRAGRAAKAGSKAGRMVKLIRVTRLMRLTKLVRIGKIFAAMADDADDIDARSTRSTSERDMVLTTSKRERRNTGLSGEMRSGYETDRRASEMSFYR